MYRDGKPCLKSLCALYYSIGETMEPNNNQRHHEYLQSIAYRAMLERGLLPEFDAAAKNELSNISRAAQEHEPDIRDLRQLLWCSIDNQDSEDLDQLSYAERCQDDCVKVYVAVADVDALVREHSALDKHARHNTCTVYTAARIFPMLPEKLSTNYSSLGYRDDRLAIVTELKVDKQGAVNAYTIYRAWVQNKAKLSYNRLADWLDGDAEPPEAVTRVAGLAENLMLQFKVAQEMKNLRYERGALEFETIHAKPVFENGDIKDLIADRSNGAKDIVADFMIATNGAVARFLDACGYPSIRRVVKTPRRWDRIVELAKEHGYSLPLAPDPKELHKFLMKEKAADKLRFPDISQSVIKLLGSGEYIVEKAGEDSQGHFGLAVKDYTHSTAPNRRYPDLLTQRLVKAALKKQDIPYSDEELVELAKHCSQMEDAVKKVERQVSKAAAALLLQGRMGEEFKAIVTGASPKGTWVRLFRLPVEGRVVKGFEGADVGHKIRVKLVGADVERGFIDFVRV